MFCVEFIFFVHCFTYAFCNFVCDYFLYQLCAVSMHLNACDQRFSFVFTVRLHKFSAIRNSIRLDELLSRTVAASLSSIFSHHFWMEPLRLCVSWIEFVYSLNELYGIWRYLAVFFLSLTKPFNSRIKKSQKRFKLNKIFAHSTWPQAKSGKFSNAKITQNRYTQLMLNCDQMEMTLTKWFLYYCCILKRNNEIVPLNLLGKSIENGLFHRCRSSD